MISKNIICPVCGASCDYIHVDYDGENITVKNACKMGNAKFHEIVSHHRIKEPQIKENGTFRKAEWDEALDKTAEILVNAKRPLLFMGSETSCEAMEVGLHIAEYLGAVVDSNSTVCHGPTAMGIQEAGRVGSTACQPKHRNAELAFNLVKELNGYTKFVIGALRGHCNVAGFNQIASYIYGYPFGPDFARGFLRLDDVPVYFQPFTKSPFGFTESNEDTMKQLFERIKKLK